MNVTTVGVVLGIYLLPAIVAFARRHRNRHALAKLNLFGGWTIFGWLTALVWALYAEPSSYPHYRCRGGNIYSASSE